MKRINKREEGEEEGSQTKKYFYFFIYSADFDPKTGKAKTLYPTITDPYLTSIVSNVDWYSFIFIIFF
jgi:hypothetical protein